MNPFFKNNSSVIEVEVEEFMSSTIKSLKHFKSLWSTSLSLSVHPQLKKLELYGNGTGRNGCAALATLLWWTTTELHTLDVDYNGIDEEEVQHSTLALAENRKLQKLSLRDDSSITVRGLQAVSTMLEAPNSNLPEFFLANNSIGYEGAVFVL